LCDYAVKLTVAPGAITQLDVTTVREAGFTDAAITIAVQVIGYFNYINRIADGLGVEPESWMTLAHEKWQATKGHDYLPGL